MPQRVMLKQNAYFGDGFKLELNTNDDGQALQSYALYLRGCGNAVQDLPDLTA